ncbi:MAG: hypothetical protein ACREON_18935 [Gemmatimonadaceae bacterium]
MRALYVVGFGYVAFSGLVLLTGWRGGGAPEMALPADAPPVHQPAPGPAPALGSSAEEWFASMKPYCNTLEVETRHSYTPPPATSEGAAYSAACYALAGKIVRARQIILGLSEGDRRAAASVVFQVGHPVADAGDDASAGPIMRLVVEFTPENYMALYHAGISEKMLGENDFARRHLEMFLEAYRYSDGWRASAISALRELGVEPQLSPRLP